MYGQFAVCIRCSITSLLPDKEMVPILYKQRKKKKEMKRKDRKEKEM
jgi:hypothetical protein